MKHLTKLAFAALGAAALLTQTAPAQTLFTTTGDFAGWSGSSGTTAGPSTAWDFDGATINGLGNNGGANGAGTAGSLSIQGPPTANWTDVAWSPGEAWLPLFMHTVDPGSVASWSESVNGYGQGQTADYSGHLQMTYTFPDNEYGDGAYLQLGVAFNYPGHWDTFFGSETAFSSVNGLNTATVDIPYTIHATADGSLGYFSMGIMYNSNYGPFDPFYVDNIAVTMVPEPSTLALFGLGALGFAMLRRRK
jgi:PEP-CTERM motif